MSRASRDTRIRPRLRTDWSSGHDEGRTIASAHKAAGAPTVYLGKNAPVTDLASRNIPTGVAAIHKSALSVSRGSGRGRSGPGIDQMTKAESTRSGKTAGASSVG